MCLARILAILFVAALPQGAAAQSEPQDISAERLTLPLGEGGILSVESGAVPRGWGMHLAGWYAHQPIRAQNDAMIDARLAGELGGYWAPMERFSLGLALPIIGYQTRSHATLPDVQPAGLGMLRSELRGQLVASSISISMALQLSVPLMQGNYFADDGVVVTPSLAISGAMARIRWSANGAYASRPQSKWSAAEHGSDVTLRLGVARTIAPSVDLEAAFSGAVIPARDWRAGPSEALLGVSLRRNELPRLFGATGVGLGTAWGTPAFRVIVGVAFSQRRTVLPDGEHDACPAAHEDIDGFADDDGCPDPDNDDDGVVDLDDGAPLLAEDRDGIQDADGVPEEDADGDHIADASDRCPLEAESPNGLTDEDGCPDRDLDRDQVEDVTDACKAEAEDKDGFADEDGCPEENDNDGIPDVDDACPNEAGGALARGCPERDRDGDGLLDRLDNCPTTAGPAKFVGCQAAQLVALTDTDILLKKTIAFAPKTGLPSSESLLVIRDLANVLVAHPEIRTVIVESHTDDSGEDGDMATTVARAEAVRDALVALGVATERVRAVGRGWESPIRYGATVAARKVNRRIVIVVP